MTRPVPTVKPTLVLSRPRPPEHLTSLDALIAAGVFVPAPELADWIAAAYLDEKGALFNAEHVHLRQARIGVLWTNVLNSRRQRRIVGQAEIPARGGGTLGVWARARIEQQVREWFGELPDFMLTFDAVHAANADDASFCALVDHELYHCAQQQDDFGAPKFNKDTGKPLWTMRGHDVEEFVGVVRRFGIEAAGDSATDLVIAAASPPEIAAGRIGAACGTCLRVAA